MLTKDIITAERLRELLNYDPETGIFTRRRFGSGRPSRGIVGTINNHGYLTFRADGRTYCAHRLAWLYQNRKWPDSEIDHINMDKADNRWCNLREATRSQNMAAARARTNCASWFKGVNWHKGTKRWRARIKVNGKEYSLGLFPSEHLAYAAYCIAARKHFGEFARIYEADQMIIPRKLFEERVLRNLLIATQSQFMEAA